MHFTARTERARQLLRRGQAVRAKGSWARTGADALQDELRVADIFAPSLADLKAAVRACLVPAPCLSRHTGNSASLCAFPVCFSLRVKGCERWELHCSWKASQALSGAKKWKAGDHKHPPGVVHDGILCPRAPARGTVVHKDAAHILGQVQGAGEGSNTSFCSCVLHVKLHIHLQG